MTDQQLDISQLLANMDSNDLMENINKLSMMMGSPEKGVEIKSLLGTLLQEKNQQVKQVSKTMQHTDPAVNLLLALKPFLANGKQKKVDKYLQTMNMSFFMQQLNQVQQSEGNK